ncbi:MAG: hypothetical protein HY342_12765 [Candidatus Lambdaproteobacteria bacterium]|nr:hypothetical protein [Candidatus Lambdaproteobacteria bacterium]
MALGVAVWLTLALLGPWSAHGQGAETSIFQRFAIDRDPPRNWQALLEYPLQLRPNSNPDADMVENTGLNYVVSFAPHNRVYVSRAYHFARMEWQPEEPGIAKEQAIEFGVSDFVNFRVRNWLVFSMGLGLAVMDGTIVFRDGDFQNRLEPFIPLHLALIFPLTARLALSVKLSQSSYFGPGPGLSVTRLLAGIGYNY